MRIWINQDRVAANNIEENEIVCDTLDVKEELVIDLKGLKTSRAPGAHSMVNEFLKYDGSEVRNKLLKIVTMIFEKEDMPSNFRQTLIKTLYKKGDKSECSNYWVQFKKR